MTLLQNVLERFGLHADANAPGMTNSGLSSTLGMFFTSSGDSGTRTSTVFMPTDSRREVYYQNRMEIVKKSRWLFNNLGLFRRLINGIARYSVGDGLTPIPETKDADWNKAAREYFDDWASNASLCDVQNKKTFWAMQKQCVKSMLKDGEFFAIMTSGGDTQDPFDETKTVLGRPQLQWIETNVVSNQRGTNVDLGPDGFREGIKCNSLNRALEYRVLQDRDPLLRDLSTYRDIPQNSMVHVFDCDRAGLTHGLPWGYSGANSSLDILDLSSLEKAAVKLHSTLAGAIKKKTPDAGLRGFSGNLNRRKTVGADGKQKVVAFEQFMGGAAILQLATDEEFSLLKSERPAQTWLAFLDYLVRDIAYGFGVSPEFIWNVAGMGGANTRFILEDSKWFFAEIQTLITDLFCQRIYVWVIARAMKRGELAKCTDVRWWNCRWQAPAQITVDAKNDGNLEIEKIRNLLGTWGDYYAARGKVSSDVIAARIQEIKETLKMCEDAGIPPSLLFQVEPGSPASTALQQLDASAAGIVDPDAATATTGGKVGPDGKPLPTDEDGDQQEAATLSERINAYGLGVRAGTITPQEDDEAYWRQELGAPKPSSNVAAAWKKDEGSRRPITLTPPPSDEPPPAPFATAGAPPVATPNPVAPKPAAPTTPAK